MLQRAYSLIEVKSFDDDERVIEGIATTPSPDRMRDRFNPLGAKFTLPIPFLWQHDHRQPIGEVFEAAPNDKGIPFKARIARTDEPETLKNRLDEAWQSMKLGLVRAVSIGFRELKYSFMDDGGVDFEEWDWLELSGVTIPANPDAAITAVRSLDHIYREVAGIPDPEIPLPLEPAASGNMGHVVKLNEPVRDRTKTPFVLKSNFRPD